MDWKNIINVNNPKFEKWSNGEAYEGKNVELSSVMGAEKLGFHLEILSPKKYSCPYHFHHSEEELFIVLEGSATLRQNGEFREVAAGDVIFFKTGEEGAHQFYNHTDQDFKFIALSNIDPKDIAEYPDSQKINIRKSRKIFKMDSAVPYSTGEEHPENCWDGYKEKMK